MALDVKTGVDFGAYTYSAELETSIEEQLTVDASLAMSKDIEIDWYIECSGEQGAEGGVGLWQFVV